MEKIEKKLPVELSDEELKVKTSELTTALKKRGLIEVQKKGAMAGFKKQLEDIGIEILELTSIVTTAKNIARLIALFALIMSAVWSKSSEAI